MAIQVTGLFENPKSKQLFQSPKLELVPHLTYRGKIKMDVHIISDFKGTIGYENIERSELQYDSEISDPYTQLIDALETYVIEHLSQTNPQCTFEKNVIFEEEIEQNNPIIDDLPDEQLI